MHGVDAGLGPVAVCAAMFVFLALLLIQWTEAALLLSVVCLRKREGGGLKLRADGAGLEFSHKLV